LPESGCSLSLCETESGPGSDSAQAAISAKLILSLFVCRVEYGLNAIICCSREEHELTGDGSFLDDEQTAAELHALPECANDDDYAMARRMLCNANFAPPKPNYDSEEEMEEEEFDMFNLPVTSRGLREFGLKHGIPRMP